MQHFVWDALVIIMVVRTYQQSSQYQEGLHTKDACTQRERSGKQPSVDLDMW